MPRSIQNVPPILALIALTLLAGAASGQAMDCAQFNEMGQEIVAARDADPAAAVARGRAALEEIAALQPPCPDGKAMLLGGIATNLTVMGRDREAIVEFGRALEVLGGSATPAQVAFLNRGIGVAYAALESYEDALGHYLTALAASDEAQDRIESAKTASNIGIVYLNIDQLERSREYLTRSLANFEQVGFKPGIAGALINLGSVAGRFGGRAISNDDPETARREYLTLREHNERALGLFTAMDNQRGVAYASSNIGLALHHLGEPLQALPHHQRALALRRTVGDVFGTIDSLLSLATTMVDLDRHEEAGVLLDQAEAIIPGDAFNLRASIARQRVRLAEKEGEFQAALQAQRDVTHYAALGADADQLSKMAALQDRFDADAAARQIELLRSDAEIGKLKLQRQRQVARLSGVVAVLAFVLLALLFSRYRMGIVTARKLTLAARTDDLTGLSNRRHMLELIQYEMNRAERGGQPFSLLMIDLDDFKLINDSHGHDAGDAVLREVSRRLRETVRSHDSIARWGGEEFLLLLPETKHEGGLSLAKKLRQKVAATPFTLDNARQTLPLTATVGVSTYELGMTAAECIKLADQSLYRGKQAGKDRVGATRMQQSPA